MYEVFKGDKQVAVISTTQAQKISANGDWQALLELYARLGREIRPFPPDVEAVVEVGKEVPEQEQVSEAVAQIQKRQEGGSGKVVVREA